MALAILHCQQTQCKIELVMAMFSLGLGKLINGNKLIYWGKKYEAEDKCVCYL